MEETGIAFALCWRTQNRNIILQTHLNTAASQAFLYLDTIAHSPFEKGITTTNLSINSKWTKHVIHNIPTSLGEGVTAGNLLAAELKTALPQVTLSQIPR
jgi:hypothetical protein